MHNGCVSTHRSLDGQPSLDGIEKTAPQTDRQGSAGGGNKSGIVVRTSQQRVASMGKLHRNKAGSNYMAAGENQYQLQLKEFQTVQKGVKGATEMQKQMTPINI